MPEFQYVGPFDEVSVPDLGAVVKRGEKVTADGDIAKSLADQADWQAVNIKKKEG